MTAQATLREQGVKNVKRARDSPKLDGYTLLIRV